MVNLIFFNWRVYAVLKTNYGIKNDDGTYSRQEWYTKKDKKSIERSVYVVLSSQNRGSDDYGNWAQEFWDSDDSGEMERRVQQLKKAGCKVESEDMGLQEPSGVSRTLLDIRSKTKIPKPKKEKV